MKRVWVLLMAICGILIAQESESNDPRAIIEKIRIYRLTEELDLTTEQAIEFFPRLRELQKIDADFRIQQKAILNDLREQVESEAQQEDIVESINRLEIILKERVERRLDKMKEIRNMLTPSQQARYLIFQDDFEREIRQMIKEVKRLRPQ